MSKNTHPEDVKAMIRKRFGSIESLSARCGVKACTLRQALRRRTPLGNRAIARALNKRPAELWPEWFDANTGLPRSAPRETADLKRVAA